MSTLTTRSSSLVTRPGISTAGTKGSGKGNYAVLAGGAAGLTEVLIMYPLDTVKTRKMLQVENANMGVLQTIRGIVGSGGVGALYRGILPPICMEAPKRAVKFATNDLVSPILLRWTNSPTPTQTTSILAGASGGIVESLIVAPFEKVKIRMQDKTSLGRYTSSGDCFVKTLRSEGPATFLKGLQATVFCQGIWSAGYFGTIYRVRQSLPTPTSRTQIFLTNLAAGFTGGFVGTVMNTPFDVVKSRVQNMELGRDGRLPNVWTVLMDVGRREGKAAWYKGFGPKVMRLAPGGGILLALFELAKGGF